MGNTARRLCGSCADRFRSKPLGGFRAVLLFYVGLVMLVAEGFMSEFDAPVKYSVICICAYLMFIVAMPERKSRAKYVAGGLLSLLPALLMTLLRDVLLPFHVISMVAVFTIVMMLFFKLQLNEAVVLSTLSFGFSYVGFFVSTLLVLICGAEYCEIVMGDYQRTDLFFESAVVHVVTVLVMQIVYFAIIWLFLRTKRFRSGIANIVQLGMSDVGVYISVMILLVTTLFGTFNKFHVSDITSTVVMFLLLSSIITMEFWVKREIKAAYIHNKMTDEAALLKKSLAEKDKLIAELREDNDRLAGIIHKDNKLIPAMVMSVKQCALADTGECGGSESAADALEIAEQLEEIYEERAAALSCYESHCEQIPSTGVLSVDAVLFYMARRAANDHIQFTAAVSADVKDMTENVIERQEFNTVLADLMENALLAAKDSEVKAVSVEIGSEGGHYFLRVSDSGGAFDESVLRHMGLQKITTRLHKGGSGTGLMNLFAVLRKYRAGFSIEECPPDSVFTKSLTVSFDGSGTVTAPTAAGEQDLHTQAVADSE